MGSCWSNTSEADYQPSRRRCNENTTRVVINSTYVTNGVCVPRGRFACPQSCYGEYSCQRCGRYWKSTLSWPNTYQVCKHCNTKVYPKNQRALRPSDKQQSQGPSPEHVMELCQRCQQLGRYCGSRPRR